MWDLVSSRDALPLAGKQGVLLPGRQDSEGVGRNGVVLCQLARASLDVATPCSLVGKVRGYERGTDLKKVAVFPIVHGLRTLARRHRIHHNNSFDRAQA